MKLKDIIQTIDIQAHIAEQGSKLAYSFEKKNRKAFDKLKDQDKGYSEKLSNKQLDLALVGDKQEILYNDKGGMIFTKEATKELNKFNKELLDEDYSFEFYIIDYSKLTDNEKNKISNIDNEEYQILSRFISNIPPILEISE